MKILSAMILAFTSVAFADITITAGNTGSFVDKNVLFNLAATGTSNTDPVIGYLAGTATLVGFDSTDLLVGNGGQARLEALDGSYTDLSFSVTGNTFLTAVLNLQPVNPTGPPQDGTVIFTIQRQGEADFVSGPLAISDSGENFFSIEATNNQKILSVSYVSTLEIADTRQIRIGGEAPIGGGDPVIPEPMTMTLMGAGLGVIGLLRKKFQA